MGGYKRKWNILKLHRKLKEFLFFFYFIFVAAVVDYTLWDFASQIRIHQEKEERNI